MTASLSASKHAFPKRRGSLASDRSGDHGHVMTRLPILIAVGLLAVGVGNASLKAGSAETQAMWPRRRRRCKPATP